MSQRPISALTLIAFLSACAGGPQVTSALRRNDETLQIAAAAATAGDPAEAARLYDLAIERDPASVPALLGLARSHAASGQVARAESALDRAEALSPGAAEIAVERGRLALTEGDGTAALTAFEGALARAPRDLAALTGKAVSLDYLSRHAEAQEVYTKALRLYPANFILLGNRALSQVLSGDAATGISVMQELLADPAQGESVRANLALAQALEGNTEKARSLLAGHLPKDQIAGLLALGVEARAVRSQNKPIGHLVF